MAHPLLEAIYIGLFAGGVAQPVEIPNPPVVAAPGCVECAAAAPARAPRVVYDWASGTRNVYASVKPNMRTAPTVGITEWQIRRLNGSAAG
jgi:hypothetical protein